MIITNRTNLFYDNMLERTHHVASNEPFYAYQGPSGSKYVH